MRFRPLSLLSLAAIILPANAEYVLKSNSLAACQDNSGFTASLFDVVFTPNNLSATIDMIATSSVEGKVVFDITILAYGYEIIRTVIDPCTSNLPGLCPMTSGKMNNPFNIPVTKDAIASIPGIAYTFPDLDATVKVFINMTSGDQIGQSIACVTANISNGKTVDLVGVKWATAAVIGLALLSAAILSGLGYSNAASHVAANTISLFGYFQAQAMIGLTGVKLPPAVSSWTQDFQWSMGIIRAQFMQDILTWYQRSTGGTASNLLDRLSLVSVQVEKRAVPMLEAGMDLFKRSAAMLPSAVTRPAAGLMKRANIQTDYGSYIVYGIQRVAFRAEIETTNLFLTGLAFFYIFVLFTAIIVILAKVFCELFAKIGWMKGDTFSDFRHGWLTMLKGILFRVTMIGLPQMAIFCLWEFTQKDSPAAVTLAVFFFFGMLACLLWASYKIIMIARRSVALHRNPAYILFSDPQALNKWGFLYVQYRASAYYWILPVIGYVVVKGMFIALAQNAGTVQAVALMVIEVICLIACSVLRPWMDKSTNTFNIAICVMNFLNAIFLFIFTDVFDLPGLVIGVVGVVLWIANAAFSLILLLMLIITTTILLFHNNPDTRYQFMHDDRTSFMKSNSQLHANDQLAALAATARGDSKNFKPTLDLDDDNDSAFSNPANAHGAIRPGTANSHRNSANSNSLKSNRNSTHWTTNPALIHPQEGPHDPYLRSRASGSVREPSPLTTSSSNISRQSQPSPPNAGKPTSSANQWQRGAGYE